ncbi:ABC transporter permease [Mycolicibacterium wolinskyi]|uniref:ABC transporter permease n=1 Tax=Mycolicibacterium wolinskyi TaxID=59750 RepID=A0A132PCU3_9MYCO|nr:iron ABC transporter permease [Mycolicibacterium wolinskyi]KWX20150.1 ABC transporter permease [Mycolicibacterium wolinskyi]
MSPTPSSTTAVGIRQAPADSPPPGPPASGADVADGPMRRWLKAFIAPRSFILLAVVIVIGYLTLTPLLYLAYGTFFDKGGFTFGGFARAYTNPELPSLISNSLIFTVGATLLSFVTGTFLAYVTVRTNVPFRPLLVATAMVPLIIPGLLYTIAWIMLSSERVGILNQLSNALIGRPFFDIFSMAGMIWVEGTHSAPLVFLFMVAAFRSMDPALEESALVCGASKLTMIRRVTLPLTRPAIAGALLVTGVNALTSFEVPVLLGLPDRINVFVSEIFDTLRQYPYDYGAAGALSIGLVVISVVGVWAVSKLGGQGKEYATVTGKGFRPRPLDLGRARGPVGALVVLYFAVTTVLPVLVMLYNSLVPYYQGFSFASFGDFTFSNYTALFDNRIFTRSVVNSVILSAGAATVVMVLTALAAWLVIRTRTPGRQIVDQLTFLPLIVPGLVMGVAISFVYLRNPLPVPVYGTLLILMIAYVTRFLPYGMRYATSSLTQISAELEESAAVSGASWFQAVRRVVLPLMMPGIVAGWIYIVIVSIRELSSSILLYSPGNEVLAIVTFQFYEKGEMSAVAALGVLMVATLVAFVTIAYKLGANVGLRTD